jgi:hypothetical protein
MLLTAALREPYPVADAGGLGNINGRQSP